MKYLTSLVVVIFLLGNLSGTASAFVFDGFTGEKNAKPQLREIIQKEMEYEKEEQIKFHLKEFNDKKDEERFDYLSEYGMTTATDDQIKKLHSKQQNELVESYFRTLLNNAYIYKMDDNGYIYDKDGDVVTQLELSKEEEILDAPISSYAATLDPNILGYNSGAFVRQTTSTGYKGIKTTFNLPTDPNFEVVGSNTGYIYNGIDILSSSYLSGYKFEAGLQYSEAYNNYYASIRPYGSTQIYIPENHSSIPPRYAAGTNMVSNLLYDTTSSKFKYFVTGTNVNGASQYIYFYHSKTFTSGELAAMCVKRVVSIATPTSSPYTGNNIGKVNLTYTGTTVTNTSGVESTLVSSMLSTHTYSGKTHGTSDSPSVAVTKTGTLATQTVKIDTTGL